MFTDFKEALSALKIGHFPTIKRGQSELNK